jgi:hypothetical protein
MEALPTIDISGLTFISACGLSNHRADGKGGVEGEDPVQLWQQVLGPAFKGADPSCALPAGAVR